MSIREKITNNVYFRVHDTKKLSLEDITDPKKQKSKVWHEDGAKRKCSNDKCGKECSTCGGSGHVIIHEQNGVSVTKTITILENYFSTRSGADTEDTQVLLIVEGKEKDEDDVDKQEGAVLISVINVIGYINMPNEDKLDENRKPTCITVAEKIRKVEDLTIINALKGKIPEEESRKLIKEIEKNESFRRHINGQA